MEIERKFKVGKLPNDITRVTPRHIIQGYISTTPDLRIRKDDDEYYLTMKGKGLMCREEYTLEITAEEFNHLSSKVEGRFIEKFRYCVPLESGEIAEVDRYTGDLGGLQVVEVEFKTKAEATAFKPPEWFSTEITEDKAYKNSSLAMNGLPNLN